MRTIKSKIKLQGPHQEVFQRLLQKKTEKAKERYILQGNRQQVIDELRLKQYTIMSMEYQIKINL